MQIIQMLEGEIKRLRRLVQRLMDFERFVRFFFDMASDIGLLNIELLMGFDASGNERQRFKRIMYEIFGLHKEVGAKKMFAPDILLNDARYFSKINIKRIYAEKIKKCKKEKIVKYYEYFIGLLHNIPI